MSYLHIDNLYKNKNIFMLRECYALEKVHGTSAHIRWKDGKITYSQGGSIRELFVGFFNEKELIKKFSEIGRDNVVVYGEAYGGNLLRMYETYGKELRFIVFDVKINDMWLNVPQMERIAKQLNLENVSYNRIPTTIEAINAERDLPSVVGEMRGFPNKRREGVVLRPIVELQFNSGKRIICKHKHDDFCETKTPRLVSEEELKILSDAHEIAEEWVTPMRLTHVLDKVRQQVAEPLTIKNMSFVLYTMVEDIEREGNGEIVMGKATRGAICRATALLFQEKLKEIV